MRIVHLSDLHFGTVRSTLVEPLLGLIDELRPRVVAVSGDLTQRARRFQFSAAADFLKRIPFAQVVVPGNHDIPLWSVIDRFTSPLRNYRRYLGENVEPSYRDEHLAVIGVNTARSFTWKGGRISNEQIKDLASRLSRIPEKVFKVVVMHHPIVPLTLGQAIPALGRSRKALQVLENQRSDVILAGHGHLRYACRTRRESDPRQHSIVVIQAGTALSDRTRGMLNSFNVVDLGNDAVTIIPYEWLNDRAAFTASAAIRFERQGALNRS